MQSPKLEQQLINNRIVVLACMLLNGTGECTLTDRWKTVLKKGDLFKQLAFPSLRLFSHSATCNTTFGKGTSFRALGSVTVHEKF